MKIPKKWFFYGIAFPITLIATGWAGGSWWVWASSAPSANANNPYAPKVRLTIPDGTPMQIIGQELESAGIIRSSLALRIWLQWLAFKEGDSRPLQAGTYDFATNQPLAAIVNQMQTGKPVEVKFTIPEGWSIAQMGSYFEQQGYFSASDFVLAASSKSALNRKSWLPNNIPSLEGFLYPDTYQLPPSEINPDRIIDLMLARFEQVALPVYRASQDKANSPKVILSLGEWVTLASIVEKEAVLDKERRIIASVFWQRLKKDMRLEADPTVEYGLNIQQTPEQPLTLEQVRTYSPYNTYLIQGLPPGAIAAPGLASLKAVLNPENTDYLYFVARYDGSHIFSRTLEDHQRAQQQVSDQLKQQAEKSSPAPKKQ